MTEKKLYINKLLVDLTFPGITDSRIARLKAKEQFEEKILPGLEKISSGISDEDIILEHLEIDLGRIGSGDLAERILSSLGSAINQAGQSQEVIKMTRMPEEIPAITDDKDLQSLVFYLIYGYSIPSTGISRRREPAYLLERIIKSNDEHPVSVLSAIINGRSGVPVQREILIYRLLKLIPQDKQQELLLRFAAVEDRPVLPGFKTIFDLSGSARDKGLINAAESGKITESLFYFYNEVIRSEFLDKVRSVLERTRTFVGSKMTRTGEPGLSLKKEITTLFDLEKKMPEIKVPVPGKDLPAAMKQMAHESSEDFWQEKERYFIGNAGLVLIAPFIPMFFDTLGLTGGNDFKTDAGRQRALFLLRRIVYPKGKVNENESLLDKLLCGIPQAEPINTKQRLTQTELSEISDLLTSVIAHWEALKNTSVEGFREAFLRRKGTVERSGEDFLVRVESKGHDVLLDSVPWSFSMIKLPWNQYIIHTEWKQR